MWGLHNPQDCEGVMILRLEIELNKSKLTPQEAADRITYLVNS